MSISVDQWFNALTLRRRASDSHIGFGLTEEIRKVSVGTQRDTSFLHRADMASAWPAESFVRITGYSLSAGGVGTWLRADDWTFSNSLTVEHNVLAPGAIGHIARHRSINTAIYTATDRWFHYDQVGSVMLETNASGAVAATYQPDAFGNQMASWQTGLWMDSYASRKGWHHNTKEFDGDTGLVYMYQRWYLPETGLFISKSPLPRTHEAEYTFGDSQPMSRADPEGLLSFPVILLPPEVAAPWIIRDSHFQIKCWLEAEDADETADRVDEYLRSTGMESTGIQGNTLRHCAWQCCLSKHLAHLSLFARFAGGNSSNISPGIEKVCTTSRWLCWS